VDFVDALDEVLRSLRMGSSLLSRARYGEPWSVVTKGAPFPILHAIVEGRCLLLREGEAPLRLGCGDVVVLPQGSPHVMASRETLDPVPVPELFSSCDGRVNRIEHGGPGDGCVIICGTFHLDHEAGGWLLGMLPEVIHMRPSGAVMNDFIDGTLRLLDAELGRQSGGSAAVVERLTDLLVLQALRHEAVDGAPLGGWLAAVRDDRVGKALALMHASPGADWTVDKLASRCGMSRSRFYDRFSDLLGEPPKRYLARWRANAAADMIRREDVSNAEAAEAVGYSSEQAFTAAFRRHLGVSPAAYRRGARAVAH
jgi:AraC-like DNA-binding protein